MAVLNLVINGRAAGSSKVRTVCNAIFAASGKRIRRLPIQPQDLHRS